MDLFQKRCATAMGAVLVPWGIIGFLAGVPPAENVARMAAGVVFLWGGVWADETTARWCNRALGAAFLVLGTGLLSWTHLLTGAASVLAGFLRR